MKKRNEGLSDKELSFVIGLMTQKLQQVDVEEIDGVFDKTLIEVKQLVWFSIPKSDERAIRVGVEVRKQSERDVQDRVDDSSIS